MFGRRAVGKTHAERTPRTVQAKIHRFVDLVKREPLERGEIPVVEIPVPVWLSGQGGGEAPPVRGQPP